MSKQKKHESQEKAERQRRQQRQQLLTIGVVGAIALVFFGLFMALIASAGSGPVIGKYDLLYQTTTPSGIPILGDSHTALTIAEISDFGCAGCLTYQATVQQVIDKYVRPGQARLEFVIIMNHPHSDVASQVALCAGQQHKFWEMHDSLYAVQAKQGTDGFTLDNLRHVAESLGIDSSALLNCVTDGGTRSALNAALSFYNAVHGTGTPMLLWSADGKTNWQSFVGDDHQPYVQGAVPLPIIDRTIADYYRAHSS
ncbi:MAG: DsbA family protein [Aggregatilineales bacterium]